ncbi:MAG: bifunctional nuclease family protein [Chloroflexi bacterium]|nr:bifunctional nuclease family protein [Chloroflexota bacterium]
MVLLILRRLLRRVLTRGLVIGRLQLAVGAVLLLALVGGGAYFGLSRLLSGGGSEGLSGTSEVSVVDLQRNPTTGQVLMVLKEKAGTRRLVMVVGDTEARTIFDELQGARSDRLLTYDLMREIVQRLGARISHVLVNHVSETTFYAKVILATEGRQLELDSRPSDAIALALRSKAPIFVDSQVLDKAGIASPN